MDPGTAILAHEPLIRLGGFALMFLAVAGWELAAPRRAPRLPRARRWAANLGLVALNTLLLRLLLPLAAAGVAALAAGRGWGVLHLVELPTWVAVLVAVVALDFVVWLQHVILHAVPALWRLHRVHHADLDYDVTTGTRFHPLEIGLSMLVKLAAILVIGPPVLAVVVFEALLNLAAMFNHGNIQLPGRLDRLLRWVIVTPDMHRVHHSVEPDEMNSNFGFNLPWWDRLFGTYRAQPRAGHAAMVIGLPDLRDPRQVQRLGGMLALPWRGRAPGSALTKGVRRRTGPAPDARRPAETAAGKEGSDQGL